MSNVEERVLSMKLDADDLEKNSKTALKTLKALDDALKFEGAAKGLENFQNSVNNIDFTKLASDIDVIAKRSSTLGVVGAKVLSDLTGQVEQFAVKALKKLNPLSEFTSAFSKGFSQILTGGMSRATGIDQAQFKIEGLGQDWDKVKKRMEYGVNDTSYSMDQAAKAASQFLAAGVKMSEAWDESVPDELGNALRGLSGVAAITGSNYDLLADIFIDAAAAGKVSNDTFNRLSAQGLNAASDMAKYLNKSTDEIKKMASKGTISFAQLGDAMNKYYGEQAVKSNETFEGALANMKSALNRIGEDFYHPIRKAATDIFNATRKQLNAIKKKIETAGIYDKFTSLMEKIATIQTTIIKGIPLGWLDGLLSKASMALDVLNDLASAVANWVGILFPAQEEAAKAADEVVDAVDATDEHITELANRVIRGDFGNGEERRKALEDLGECYEIIQNKVNELLDDPFRYDVSNIQQATTATEKNATATDKFKSAQDRLIETRDKFISKQKEFMASLRGTENVSRIKNALTGLKSAFQILGNIVASIGAGAVDAFFEFGRMCAEVFISVGEALGNAFTNLHNFLLESGAYEKIQEVTAKVTTKFNNALKKTGEWGKKAFEVVKNGAGKATGILSQAKDNAVNFFTEFQKTDAYQRLTDGFDKVRDKILEIKDVAIAKVKEAITNFMGTEITLPAFDAESFASNVSDKIVWLLDKFNEIKEAVKGFFSSGGEGENSVSIFDSIKNFFTDLTFQNALDWFVDRFEDVKKLFKEFIQLFTGTEVSASDLGVTEAFDPNGSPMATTLDSMQGYTEAVTKFLEWIKDTWETLKGVLSDVKEGAESLLESIGSLLGDSIESFPTQLEQVPEFLKSLIPWFAGFETVSLFASLGRGLWNLSGIFKGVNKFLKKTKNIQEIVDSVVGAFKSIPESIAGIFDGFKYAVTNLADGAYDALESIAKLNKSKGRLNTGKAIFFTLIGIAAAVAAFAAAIYFLGQLKTGQLERGIWGMIAIVGAIAVLMVVAGQVFSKKEASKGGNSIASNMAQVLEGYKGVVKDFLKSIGRAATIAAVGLAIAAIAVAVALIGGVVKKLGSMPWQDALRGVVFVGLILGEMVGTLVLLDKFQKHSPNLKSGFLLMLVAIAARIIAPLVKTLGSLDLWTATQGAIAVGVLLAELTGALIAIDKSSSKMPSLKTGFLMVLTAFAVKMLAPLVKTLGSLDVWTAIKGVAAIGILIKELGIAIKQTDELSGEKGAFKKVMVLIATVLAVKMLANTLIKLGKQDLGVLAKGIAALGAVIFMFNSVLKRVGQTKDAKLSGLIGLAIVIGVLVGSIMILGDMDTKKLIKGVLSLSTVMVMLSIMLNNTGKLKRNSFKGLLSMVAVIAAVVIALKVLSDIDPKRLTSSTKALRQAILSLSILSFSSGRSGKNNWASVAATFGGLAIVMLAAAAAFKIMEGIDPNQMVVISDSLSKVLLSFSTVAAAAGLFSGGTAGGGFGVSFLSSLGSGLGSAVGFAALIGIVTAVAALAGAINDNFPKLKDFVDSGAELLGAVGNALGSIIGGFLTGAVFEPIKNTFTGFDTGFENFSNSIITLVQGLEGEDGDFQSALDAVQNLKDLVTALMWTGWETALTSLAVSLSDVNAITQFVADLGEIGPKVLELGEQFTTDTDGSKVDAKQAADTMKTIRTIVGAVGGAAWASTLASWAISLGGKSAVLKIRNFADELKILAQPLYDVAAAFSQVKVAEGGEEITSDDLEGKVSLVATLIRSLGSAAWANVFADIGVDLAQNGLFGLASNNPDAMTGINGLSENSGSLDDLISFAGELTGLANPLYQVALAFSKVVVDETDGSITVTADDINPSLELVKNSIKLLGGIGTATFWSDFTVGLTRQGGALHKVANDPDTIATIDEETQKLADQATSDGSISNLAEFAKSLTVLADPLYQVALAFSKTVSNEAGTISVGPDDINPKLESITKTVSLLGNIGSAAFWAAFKSGFETEGTVASTAANDPDTVYAADENTAKLLQDANAAGNGSGNLTRLISFAKNLKLLADPLYQVALAFSQVVSDGSVTIGPEDINASLENIKDSVSLLGKIGGATFFADFAVAFTGGGMLDAAVNNPSDLNDAANAANKLAPSGTANKNSMTGVSAGGNSSLSRLAQFALDLKILAGPLGSLVSTFSSITVDTTGEIITPEELEKKLETIKNMVETLGGSGSSAFWSAIKVGMSKDGLLAFAASDPDAIAVVDKQTQDLMNTSSNGNTAIGVLSQFATDLSFLVTPLSTLLTNFESIPDVSGESLSVQQVLSKVQGIVGIIDTLGDLSSSLSATTSKTEYADTGVFGAVTNFFFGSNYSNSDLLSNLQDAANIENDAVAEVKHFVDRLTTLAPSLDTMVSSYSGVIDAVNSVDEDGIKSSDPFVAIQTILDEMSNLSEKVDEIANAGTIQYAMEKLFTSIQETVEESGSSSPILNNIGRLILTRLIEGLVGTGSDVATIINTLFSANTEEDAEKAGKSMGSTIANSTKLELINAFGGQDSLNVVAESGMLDAMAKEIEEATTPFDAAVDVTMDSMARRIKLSRWKLSEAMRYALDGVALILKLSKEAFKQLGGNLMEGVAQGIREDTVAKNAMANMVNDLNTAFRTPNEIDSPSKLYERYGGYLMQGLAIGITKDEHLATASVASAAQNMIGSVSNTISDVSKDTEEASMMLLSNIVGVYSYINRVITEALDVAPTIRPVLDLTGIQNGVNGINGALSGAGYTLGTNSLSYARSMFPGTGLYGGSSGNPMSTAAAIQGIRQDIRSLGESISNMQMVLDSGQLIGSIGGGMDRELGNIQRIKERWA